MVNKTDLQKHFFGYDEQTQEYVGVFDEEIRFFTTPNGTTIKTASNYATGDIWTLEYDGKLYIATKHNYNSTEVQ